MEQEKGSFGQRDIIMNDCALFPWAISHLLCNALCTTCLSHSEGKQEMKKTKIPIFPYFSNEFVALCYYIWASQ